MARWRRWPSIRRAGGAGGGETGLGGGRQGEEPDLGVGAEKKLTGVAVNGGGIRPEGNGGEAGCLVAFGAFGWVGEHHNGRAKLAVEPAGRSRGRRCRAMVGHLRRRKESGGAMAQVACAEDGGGESGGRRRSAAADDVVKLTRGAVASSDSGGGARTAARRSLPTGRW
jgi:hypothetical protein